MNRSWPMLALLAATALVYGAFPTRTHECDAVIYASGALRGVRELAFYPAHLGFGPLEAAVVPLARAARPPVSPIHILQYVSMAAALVGLYFFDRTLRERGVAAGRAALFAGVLAASYGFWHFALQAESHILSTALLLIFLWQLCRVVDEPSAGGAARAALWLGLATLMHQRNLVLVAPALVGLALAARGPRRGAALMGSFAAVYACLAILPYLVVAGAVFGLRSLPEIRHWILGLATTGQFGYWSAQTLAVAAVGLARSFAGSHYLLAVPPFDALGQRLFARASLQDELAVAAAVPPGVRIVLFAVEIAVAVVAVVALARCARRLPALFTDRPVLVMILLGWILTLGIFTSWWAPIRTEFWIDFFPPVLLVLALPAGREASVRLLAAFVLGLAAVNLLGSIRPQSLPTTDAETNIAIALDATVAPGDVVLADIPFTGRASYYTRSFQPAPLVATATGGPAKLDSILAAADSSRRSVYLVVTPLGSDPAARGEYRDRVSRMAERYRLGPRVPIRAEIELRRLSRR